MLLYGLCFGKILCHNEKVKIAKGEFCVKNDCLLLVEDHVLNQIEHKFRLY